MNMQSIMAQARKLQGDIERITKEIENTTFKYENDYVLMTREYLCKCMDIEVNEGNMNYIGSMCNVLFKLGHIDIEVEDVVEFIDGKRVPKTYNWFRLTTQKEWEEKSKKKKRKRKNS